MYYKFVLVNVVVAVLMKHLEESNSNAAAEDLAEATPKHDADVSQSAPDPNKKEPDVTVNDVPLSPSPPPVPIISVTEADSEDNKTMTESDNAEAFELDVKEDTIHVTEKPTVHTPSEVQCNVSDDKLYCQINRDDSIENKILHNTNIKMDILRSQKTFDEPPRILQHIIYEESSDSDNQPIRVTREDRNVKRMGRKLRNHRAHLLHGMRIDSIEDHEGSSSPPYDDTRASESATSLNEFYME